jgi:FkbM family methyltransferase
MLLAEFLAAMTGGLEDVVWVSADGSAAPDELNLSSAPDVPTEQDRIPIVVWDGDDQVPSLSGLQRRPSGSRAALLADHFMADAAAEKAALALAAAGLELIHAVPIEDHAHLGIFTAYSVRRVRHPRGVDEDATTTEPTNLTTLRACTAGTGGDAVRSHVQALVQLVAEARVERLALEERLRAKAADLEQARAEMHALRTSAAMQVGRAAVDLVRTPRQGLSALPRRLRAAWRARPETSTGPDATAQPASSRHLGDDRGGGRRLSYSLRLPSRPHPSSQASRRSPAAIEIDVPASLYVARVLRRDGIGAYEPEVLPWFLGLCDTAKPGAVWDVGANIGLFGLLARAYTNRPVVGFEPTADVAHWARRIARANGLLYRIEQLAVGEAPGTATFYLSDRTDASNSLAEGFRPSSKSAQVLVESLDRYADIADQQAPAILKIDTEATEHLVLRGAQRLVQEHRPWIICEVLVGRPPSRVLTEMMRGSGYTYYQLTEGADLVEHESIIGDPTNEYPNYLLAPSRPTPDTLAAVRRWAANFSDVQRA